MRYVQRIVRNLVIAAVIGAAASSAFGIVNGEAPADEDRRFDAVGAFSYTNWLGIQTGQAEPAHENNWYGAATLIDNDKVLTAKHLLPQGRQPQPGEFSVRFRRHRFGSVGNKQQGMRSYYHVPVERWIISNRTDMAIGVLARPVTHIKPIPVDFSTEPLEQTPGLLVGWGSESNWLGEANPRNELLIGKNTFTRRERTTHIRIAEFEAETRTKGHDPRTGRPKKQAYVTGDMGLPNMHDSGGAMLLEDDDGNLRLIGVITSFRSGRSVLDHKDDPMFPLPKISVPESDTSDSSDESDDSNREDQDDESATTKPAAKSEDDA